MSKEKGSDKAFLPYGRQTVAQDDIQAVAEVLASDWLTTGPEVEKFEQRLAETVGAKFAVAVNSGTAALHAAYFAAGVGSGDEVITTPITFAATANAALYLGARPVFADVEDDTANIDPARIEEAITPRTKVLAPVDFTGQPANLDVINALARKKGLVVVEDAAHALGALYRGRRVGSLADMTTFSFHPVKHITTGEGGAVVTDNEEYYRRLKKFRNHGIVRDPAEMLENHGPWYYEMQCLGYNYRITDFQCALGTSQLRKLDRFLACRREIADRYQKEFAAVPGVRIPTVRPGVEPAWHLYVLRFEGGAALRRQIFDRLRENGLGVQVHYIPVYWHPYYRQLGYSRGLCPHAEEFYSQCISLPIYPGLKDSDIERVVTEVKNALEAGK